MGFFKVLSTIDKRLTKLEHDNEDNNKAYSNLLAAIDRIDKILDILDAKIRSEEDLLPLENRILELEKAVDRLDIDLESLKKELVKEDYG